jgi:mitochondrial fission protein ELM1
VSRATPECVVLAARSGADARPPVRIFLGTEAAQYRAERVFVWSIAQVRDPDRRYEITLMRDLEGFDDGRWTTGFTNYRFAIPHLCGGRGRAIYNDVDQIYLADPAELFDQELGGHGFLAVAEDDPSVMLMDCERMATVWTLELAQRQHKSQLVSAALSAGLYGPLAREWNARDDELPPGSEKCLHYTTLHMQPWRPFPERFAYHPNPRGELWHALERSADAAGFELFTRERPSRAYAAWQAALRPEGPPAGSEEEGVEAYRPPAPGGGGAMPCRERIAGASLADAPDADLPWLLDDLFASAQERVHLALPWDGTPASAALWQARLDAVSRRWPKLAWRLSLQGRDGRGLERRGGAWIEPRPPRVWVLTDDRPGNATQSLGLADALGWPYQRKSLAMGPAARLHNRLLGASRAGIDPRRSDPLEPPWPDLVIAAGRRTAPVALWIQQQTRGLAKLVMLGRKGGDDAELFDRVFVPAYCRLPAHPRRIETQAPLHRVTREALGEARECFGRLGELAAPRVALLVGGDSGQYRLDPGTAARIGREAAELARRRGGSLLVTTSRRLRPASLEALRDAVSGAALFHAWRPGDPENPYLGLLAWADVLVITADSESMLAEACSLAKPVYIAGLPVRRSFPWLSALREWVWRRGRAKPAGHRGTPRPQRGLARACARLIERGFVRPTRDLERLHALLIERGAARRLGDDDASFAPVALADREAAAAEVRALLGCPSPQGR